MLLVMVATLVGGCTGETSEQERTPERIGVQDSGQIVVSVYLDDSETPTSRRTVECAREPVVCQQTLDINQEPAPEICNMIMGGPERMVIEGAIADESIRLDVGRTDGCEIDRFARLSILYGLAPDSGSSAPATTAPAPVAGPEDSAPRPESEPAPPADPRPPVITTGKPGEKAPPVDTTPPAP